MREREYRNALMWAFDRLGVDGGMSPREQLHTMREIGKVLCGRRSPAATYKPNDWDSSAKLPSNHEACNSGRGCLSPSLCAHEARCQEYPRRSRP